MLMVTRWQTPSEKPDEEQATIQRILQEWLNLIRTNRTIINCNFQFICCSSLHRHNNVYIFLESPVWWQIWECAVFIQYTKTAKGGNWVQNKFELSADKWKVYNAFCGMVVPREFSATKRSPNSAEWRWGRLSACLLVLQDFAHFLKCFCLETTAHSQFFPPLYFALS